MSAIPSSTLEGLLASGQARASRRRLAALPAPDAGPDLSAALADLRDGERY